MEMVCQCMPYICVSCTFLHLYKSTLLALPNTSTFWTNAVTFVSQDPGGEVGSQLLCEGLPTKIVRAPQKPNGWLKRSASWHHQPGWNSGEFLCAEKDRWKMLYEKKQNDYPSNSPKLGSKIHQTSVNFHKVHQSSTFFQNPLNIFRYRRFLRVPSGSLELRVTPLGAGMLLPDTKLSLRTRGLGTWWLSFGRVKDMWNLIGNDL